ncbi:MAG: TusE/DsrC/DsvC family sulfur relay protein [Gammaproteobacteria bacterium]|nr:TusE/DsrC/DsvC family sulfur relay protein [Gammaproteobacteria bacterium]
MFAVNNSIDRKFDAGSTGDALLLDEEGFLLDPSLWSEHSGQMLADLRGVGRLTREHWTVIHFVRDRYLRLGAIPPMRRICRSSALSRRDIKRMFGSCLEVWRIAGLPNPGEEAKSYMG